jgi:hypothetical protein
MQPTATLVDNFVLMWHSWLGGSDLAKDTGKMSPAGNPGRFSTSTMIASAHKEDGPAKPPESLEKIGPTLLSLPPELRNNIVSMHYLISDGLWIDLLTSACADQFSYVYNTTGAVAKSIDLDLFALRRVPAWRLLIPGAYCPAGSLGQDTSPPNKSPLLTRKPLHAEMHNMHVVAFRNYWATNAFKVEVCDTQPGVSDRIVHQHLRHLLSHRLQCQTPDHSPDSALCLPEGRLGSRHRAQQSLIPWWTQSASQ